MPSSLLLDFHDNLRVCKCIPCCFVRGKSGFNVSMCLFFLGSMAEVAALTSQLDALRGKKSPGTVRNLLFPYFTILTKERKAHAEDICVART